MIDFHGLSNVVNAVSEKDRTKVAVICLVATTITKLTVYVVDKVETYQYTKLAIEHNMEPSALIDTSRRHLLNKSVA